MKETISLKQLNLILAVALTLSATLAVAQERPLHSFVARVPESAGSVVPINRSPVKQVNAEEPFTGRWLNLTTLSHSERYRNQMGEDGTHFFEDGQQRSLIAGKIKLDKAGQYSIGFRASSGRAFNWAYADYAGCGWACSLNKPKVQADMSSPQSDLHPAYLADPAGVALIANVESQGWEMYVRDLYASATPSKAITLQFGSFGFEKGYSTEITSFDDDGYLTGERIFLNDPKHLLFDQITLTSAYLGFFDKPSLFDRGSGFYRSNYRQVAVKKQINQRVGISGEYNWVSKNARTHTLRGAIAVKIPESRVFDSLRLEGYDRLNRVSLQGDDESPRGGLALVGEKKIGKFSGDFGAADIDRNYGLLTGSSFAQELGYSINGDNYNTGIRIFGHLNYQISPVLTAFGFYTHLTAIIPTIDSQGLNAGLSFDLKALANSRKRIF